jgi:hypothetical protein
VTGDDGGISLLTPLLLKMTSTRSFQSKHRGWRTPHARALQQRLHRSWTALAGAGTAERIVTNVGR